MDKSGQFYAPDVSTPGRSIQYPLHWMLDGFQNRSVLAGDQILAIQPVMGQLSKVLASYTMLYSLNTDSILK